jgi:hypothetical protein
MRAQAHFSDYRLNKNCSGKNFFGTGVDTVDRQGLNKPILAPMSRSNAGIYGTNL